MNTTDLMDAASAGEMSDFSSNGIFMKRYNILLSKAITAIRNASEHSLYATNISYELDSVMKRRIEKELTDLGYGVEFFPMHVADLIKRPELENTSIIISWSNMNE